MMVYEIMVTMSTKGHNITNYIRLQMDDLVCGNSGGDSFCCIQEQQPSQVVSFSISSKNVKGTRTLEQYQAKCTQEIGF